MLSSRLTFIVLLLFLLLPAARAIAQKTQQLGPQVAVPVRVVSAVSSEEGSLVTAVVDRPVTTPDGTLLIAANTPVEMMAEKHRSRGLGKAGTLQLIPVKTYATDNQPVLLNGGSEATGKHRKGLAWGLAAGTFAAGLTAGIIMMEAGFSTDLEDDSGDALGAAGAAVAVLSQFGWLFLLIHGNPAVIPAGTVLENVYPRQTYIISTSR